MLKGIYLASCKAKHNNYNIIYQDIDPKYNTDLKGDMLEINLDDYDYIIATPPCNYYSRANYLRETSAYSQATKHLLPGILEKLGKYYYNKPFIVENVRSNRLYKLNGIYDICDKYNINIYYIGRHTYFTNQYINLICPQHFDFCKDGKLVNNDGYRQGGSNVHAVIEIFLQYIHEKSVGDEQ